MSITIMTFIIMCFTIQTCMVLYLSIISVFSTVNTLKKIPNVKKQEAATEICPSDSHFLPPWCKVLL